MLIHDILLENVRHVPNRKALRFRNENWTYADILAGSLCLFDKLRSLRVSPGTHIGVQFNNEVEFVCSLFACSMAECVFMPIPYLIKENELRFILDWCDIGVYISRNKWEPIANCVEWIEFEAIKCQSPTLSDLTVAAHHVPLKVYEENTLAALLSTSGSTSIPKVVMLSHENFTFTAAGHSKRLGLTHNDSFLVTMPVHFSSTITTQILSCMISRTPLHFVKLPLNPRYLLDYLNKNDINSFASVPTTLKTLFSAAPRGYINTRVTTVVVSGDAVTDTLVRQTKYLFPNAYVIQTYGLTEASPRVSMTQRGDIPLSCGRPIDGVSVRIVDDQGRSVQSQTVGEVLIRGKNVMLGYYKNKELTDAIFTEGWLNTGDLGFVDGANILYLKGRKKNTINSGGATIYPEEVEELLLTVPSVDEAVVIGLDDDLLGEIPVAFVKPRTEAAVSPDELYNACVKSISNYKIPKKWFFVKSIPKTSTGKIDRYTLRHSLLTAGIDKF